MAKLSLLWARALLAQLILGLVLLSTNAFGADRVEWTSTRLKENDGSWKVSLKIFLDKAPDIAVVPMKIELTPTVYYERAIVDGDKTVTRNVPLQNAAVMVEGIDVGFLDPSSGEIQKRTQFTFPLTRKREYLAGEYKVVIRDTRNDRALGAPKTLILEGENEAVDRRTMDMSAPAPKKDEAKKEEEKKPKNWEVAEESDENWAEAPREEKPEDLPQAMKEKPGACGCRLDRGPVSHGSQWGLLLLAAAGVFAWRRRG